MQNNPSYNGGALASAPIFDILTRKNQGFILHDHFVGDTVSSSDWVMEKYITTIGTSATVTKGTSGTGSLKLTAVTSEGAQFNSNEVICPAPTAGQNIHFSFRFKVDVLTDAYGTCFLGMQANKGNGSTTEDAATSGADALTSNRDLVGLMVTAAGLVYGVSQNGTTAGTAVYLGTVAAATYVTAGFVVTANQKVEFFYEGAPIGSIEGSTKIPDAALYLDMCSFGGASGGKVLEVDEYTYVLAL